MHQQPNFEALCQLAIRAARAAGEIHMKYFAKPELAVEFKADASPVTIADRQSEEVIRQILRTEAPEFGILGEEFGAEGDPNHLWYLDPIDGTKLFVRGMREFGCLIGLVIDGETKVGVCYAPALDETYYAWDGGGAYKNGERIHVSPVTTIRDAGLCFGNPKHFRANGARWNGFVSLVDDTDYQRGYGDWRGHCLVAQGAMEIMLDPVVEAYDVSPLPVILREAGGMFSTATGATDIYGGSGISTNGHLHPEVIHRLSPGFSQ